MIDGCKMIQTRVQSSVHIESLPDGKKIINFFHASFGRLQLPGTVPAD